MWIKTSTGIYCASGCSVQISADKTAVNLYPHGSKACIMLVENLSEQGAEAIMAKIEEAIGSGRKLVQI